VEERMDFKHVDTIIEKHQRKRTALISILHDIQDEYNYLPERALQKVASGLQMNTNDLYGVATFYKSFSLTPKGKHSITFCLGTACHVRRGPKVLQEIARHLEVEPGQTTRDDQFYLQAVNCLGVCAIGPVMVVNGKYYGGINAIKAKKIIEKLNRKKVGVNS
jgi:NADH-quinone oxidoreductase subunit E